AVGAAAIALAAGLALGWWQHGGRSSVPSRPLSATATLSPRTLSFGDRLSARIDLLVNPRLVDLASVRLQPHFAPYRVDSANVRRRTGGGTLISYSYALECLSPACVP